MIEASNSDLTSKKEYKVIEGSNKEVLREESINTRSRLDYLINGLEPERLEEFRNYIKGIYFTNVYRGIFNLLKR